MDTKPQQQTTTLQHQQATALPQQTTTLQLVLAWGFVGIPLVFGVVQTLINSMKLFQ